MNARWLLVLFSVGAASVQAKVIFEARPQRIIIDGGRVVPEPPPPAKVEPPPIVEVTLEDPARRNARSYLDLDTGKTFEYGESTPEDFIGSRRWIDDKGVDLMCETRSPADGFVAYNLVVRPTNDSIDQPREFAVLREQFSSIEAQPFELVTVGATFPKTYLFRTHDGTMGVLEISAASDDPHGLKLRYRLVPEPPKAPLTRRTMVLGGRIGMAQALQQQRLQLQQMRQTLGPEHPAFKRAEQQITLMEAIVKIDGSETDPQVRALKMQKVRLESTLARLKENYPDDSPQVSVIQKQVDDLQKRIDQAAAKPKVPAATRPWRPPPATKPTPADFHL